MDYRFLDTPIGQLLLAADAGGLRRIVFMNGRRREPFDPAWRQHPAAFDDAVSQLEEYFAGKRRQFALPLAPEGPPFQQRVWNALLDIPYGSTVSYGQLAATIGQPKASRAVGLANGSNPLPIVIPCHRVIGTNGTLTGYGGGLAIKQRLLALERGDRRLVE